MPSSLQALKDNLSMNIYGKTAAQAQDEGVCLECHKPALERCYSEEGKAEFGISGLCELCFDKITGGDIG